MTSEKMPKPSASAAPIRALVNWAGAAEGLRRAPVEKIAEDDADADAGAAHANARDARADQFRRICFHFRSPSCALMFQ